jgi:anti-sigma28 factor (negative regulator of flagellin synthesis)
MKVNVPGAVAPGTAPAHPASSHPDAEVAEAVPVDRVSVSKGVQVKAMVENGVNLAATERTQRLRHLTQAVRAGTYRPNSSQLADQLLAEVKFDEHLAKVLR